MNNTVNKDKVNNRLENIRLFENNIQEKLNVLLDKNNFYIFLLDYSSI